MQKPELHLNQNAIKEANDIARPFYQAREGARRAFDQATMAHIRAWRRAYQAAVERGV